MEVIRRVLRQPKPSWLAKNLTASSCVNEKCRRPKKPSKWKTNRPIFLKCEAKLRIWFGKIKPKRPICRRKMCLCKFSIPVITKNKRLTESIRINMQDTAVRKIRDISTTKTKGTRPTLVTISTIIISSSPTRMTNNSTTHKENWFSNKIWSIRKNIIPKRINTSKIIIKSAPSLSNLKRNLIVRLNENPIRIIIPTKMISNKLV